MGDLDSNKARPSRSPFSFPFLPSVSFEDKFTVDRCRHRDPAHSLPHPPFSCFSLSLLVSELSTSRSGRDGLVSVVCGLVKKIKYKKTNWFWGGKEGTGLTSLRWAEPLARMLASERVQPTGSQNAFE